MKIGTIRQGKFKRLVRKLYGTLTDQAIRETVGLLEMLWMHTCEVAPAGDIGRDKATDQDLADAVHWDGEAKKLILALIKTGWVDRSSDPDVRLVIHDWPEHAPTYIRRKVKRNEISWAVSDRSVTGQKLVNGRPSPVQSSPTPSPTPLRGSGGRSRKRKTEDPTREDTKAHLDAVAKGQTDE